MSTESLNRDFIVLKPARRPQRPPQLHLTPNFSAWTEWLDAATTPIHFDFETTGLDPRAPGAAIVGVSVADARGCWYFDARAWGPGHPAWREFQDAGDRCGLVAFNAPFDGAWLASVTAGRVPNIIRDTLTEFRLLANEGYRGQSWALEVAVSKVLGWRTNQKHWLETKLLEHGVVTSGGKPDKSQMWRLCELEPEGFGVYGAFDAEASYWLAEVFEPQLRAHPGLWQYASEEWPNCIRLLVEQNYHGMCVDRDALQTHADRLRLDIQVGVAKVRAHPDVAPAVAEWEAIRAAEFFAPQVLVKRTRASAPQARFLNTWAASGSEYDGHKWLFEASTAKTLRKFEAAAGGFWYYNTQVEKPRNAGKPAPKFNWDSPDQLRWLFYKKLYRWERLDDKYFRVYLRDETSVDVPATKGGQLPTGKDVLPALGALGQLLMQVAKDTKQLEYVEKYLHASEATGKIHPVLKAPGTLTGRLSGDSGLNVQQLPKAEGILSVFQPPPGWRLVDLDLSSLEPNILAFFSRDPTYLELFCSGRQHDVYLYIAQLLRQEWRDAIAPVYDVNVDAAKKQFKRERDIAKTIHLACLAAGTLVRVRGQGWKPIETVGPDDVVWDGVEWANTGGAVAMGTKSTMTLNGIHLTKDHEVLTTDGWQISERADPTQCVRPIDPSGSWSEVWNLGCAIIRVLAGEWFNKSKSKMLRLWPGKIPVAQQP